MKRCRWAIVGTGEVAGKFAIGLRSVPSAEVAVIASRSIKRAESFAAQLAIPKFVGSYDEVDTTEIDAVYIATPPSEHRENALLFMAAKKPLLIEKPFAANLPDATTIVTASRSASTFCMEGMWTRFMPAMSLARKLLAEGEIGEPRCLIASFAVADIVDPSNSFFVPSLGGGVLGHRGVYPISLAFDLLGPAELVSAAVTSGATGVDEDATVVIRHRQGAISSLYASARTNSDNGLVIMGTEGALRFVGPIYRPFGIELESFQPRRRGSVRWNWRAIAKEGALLQGLRQRLNWFPGFARKRKVIMAPYIGNGYAHEAIAMMQALEEDRSEHPLMPLDTSLAIIRLIDDIKTAGETGPG